jgi:hemerythrin-like domain-containing protein
MLDEHAAGRRLVGEMSDGLARLRGASGGAARSVRGKSAEYGDLLRGHIDKENNVLFPMADRLLSDDDSANIIERFETIERDRIGPGKHEAYHEMLHRLREAYGIR